MYVVLEVFKMCTLLENITKINIEVHHALQYIKESSIITIVSV